MGYQCPYVIHIKCLKLVLNTGGGLTNICITFIRIHVKAAIHVHTCLT